MKRRLSVHERSTLKGDYDVCGYYSSYCKPLMIDTIFSKVVQYFIYNIYNTIYSSCEYFIPYKVRGLDHRLVN